MSPGLVQAGKHNLLLLWGLLGEEIRCNLEGGRTALKTLYLQGRDKRHQLGLNKQAQVPGEAQVPRAELYGL